MSEASGRKGVQSIERAMALIDLIGRNNRVGIRAADLAEATKLSVPTVHRILRALEGVGYVERNTISARYSLGSTIVALGITAAIRNDLASAAEPSLSRIVEVTEDTAMLMKRQEWHSLCIARADGTFPVRSFLIQVGDRPPLGIHSSGIAMLAKLSDDEIEQALDHNGPEIRARFPNYVPELILERVQAARQLGYSFNPTNKVSHGVAVAINGPSNLCVGALSIGAIPDRMASGRLEDLVKLLVQEKQKIERRLANPPSKLSI